ncbi:MAG: nitrile hydratase subunit beta [Chloroflexi bacterium]|nr:nitrile hydratase subunit beta [Chloroflexota bacterium]
MDGIHDLGGMHGFGPVNREQDEPAFHAEWEAAARAMVRESLLQGLFNLDEFRHAIERMAPDKYLAATYYERWLQAVATLAVEKGAATPEELARRARYFEAHEGADAISLAKSTPRPSASADTGQVSVVRPATAPPKFKAGDPIVTRDVHPKRHTRLPRYARGKRGVVDRFRGVHVFPDTNAHGLGENPQPLYSVRFDASELWGESAEGRQAVYLDLWESYLEAAQGKAA